MIITGQFRNIKNEVISLTISNDIGSEEITIGENGLYFTDNPITLEWEAEDLFTHIIGTKVTINLSTKDYLGDLLFTNNVRGYEVEIYINSNRLFYGYLDANTFNQPYVKGLNEFSLTAVDYLSTLQYFNYKDCNILTYDNYKRNADTVTFKNLIDNIIDFEGVNLYYDKSKGITNNGLNTIFNDIAISEMLFFGEDYDDVWKQNEVLEEVLRYLNLHAISMGKSIYFFDWQTIKNGNTGWFNLNTGNNSTLRNVETTFGSGVFADSDTNITIDDVFSQIQLTCDLETQDTLIQNPLDKDSLTSPYSGKQLYMTEFISEGEGRTARGAMEDMVNDRPTNYEHAKTVDHYLQFMTNKEWKFYIDGTNEIESITGIKSGDTYINQWKIPYYLKHHQIVPAILRCGSVEHEGGTVTDNSPISQIDMKDYLYISVNGNFDDYQEGTATPTENTLQNQSPVMEYVSINSGGMFSPADNTTTNYLVFSGKLLFQPIQWESGEDNVSTGNNYEVIKNNGLSLGGFSNIVPYYETKPAQEYIIGSNTIKSENNGDGRFYTRKFYNMVNPSDTIITYMDDVNLQPWVNDKSAAGFNYNYSATGDGSDQYSKIPVLECELIIGNKRLIETNIDMYGNSTFQWVTIGQEPTASYVDVDGTTKTYTITTFSLGINPKIGDKIIGTEYDLQNTISYQMNIDATGTAIPIKRSDKVSGRVQFKVIGVINSTWNSITRRHPSFWRHTKWYTATRSLLAHTENIVIKEFKCKLYSDNSLNDTTNSDKDLVYISNETLDIINKKDDIDFKFVTQLTADECREKGISTSICLNSTINKTNDLTLDSIYNARTAETAKPEEHYINQYYLEYSTPKMILQTTVKDFSTNSNYLYFRDRFFSPVLNKHFYIIGMERNLRLNSNTLKLREL